MEYKLSKEIFTEEDLLKRLPDNLSDKDSTMKWKLYNYIKENNFIRIGNKKYIQHPKLYDYEFQSEISKKIYTSLTKKYNKVKIVIWESQQLNPFLNFLLSKNIIYIEVEKTYIEFIFQYINELFGEEYLVLFKPHEEFLEYYIRNNLIVVKPLYSKSPLNKENNKITIEKLIIDVICDINYIDTLQKKYLIENIISNYDVNYDRLQAYASRRRCTELLKEFIDTTI